MEISNFYAILGRIIAIKFSFVPSYDINEDGLVNESDFEILLSFIINENGSVDSEDLNFDSVVDIFDLLFLADFLQNI